MTDDFWGCQSLLREAQLVFVSGRLPLRESFRDPASFSLVDLTASSFIRRVGKERGESYVGGFRGPDLGENPITSVHSLCSEPRYPVHLTAQEAGKGVLAVAP